jgi:CRP/FNR family cyclic AMP-dependent transcriptional regulator
MALEELLSIYITNEETHPDNSVLMEEGATGAWVYVILEGEARVTKKAPKGTVTVDTLKPGDFYGEMSFLEQGESIRAASVIAKGPVRVGLLDNQRLMNDYNTLSPEFRLLVSTLIGKLRRVTEEVSELATETRQ